MTSVFMELSLYKLQYKLQLLLCSVDIETQLTSKTLFGPSDNSINDSNLKQLSHFCSLFLME